MRTFNRAIGTLAVVALTGLSASMLSEAAAGAFATSTDPETGVTTTSVKNADGSRDVTKTDASGKVISKHNVYRDRHTGNTETTVENADGSVTHTHVDPDGKVLFVETDPPPAAPTDGISEFEEWGDSDWDDTASTDTSDDTADDADDGRPKVVSRADGSRSVRWTREDGVVVTEETDPTDDVPGGKKVTLDYPDRWTYRGPGTTNFGQVPGIRTVTMYDFDGQVLSEETLTPEDAREARFDEWSSGAREGETPIEDEFSPLDQFRVPPDVMEYVEWILAEEARQQGKFTEGDDDWSDPDEDDSQSSRPTDETSSSVAAAMVLDAIREVEGQAKIADARHLSQGQPNLGVDLRRPTGIERQNVDVAAPTVTVPQHGHQLHIEAGPGHSW